MSVEAKGLALSWNNTGAAVEGAFDGSWCDFNLPFQLLVAKHRFSSFLWPLTAKSGPVGQSISAQRVGPKHIPLAVIQEVVEDEMQVISENGERCDEYP